MPVSTEAPEYIALEIEDAVKQIHFVLSLQDYALLEDDLMCLIEIMLFSTLPEAVVGWTTLMHNLGVYLDEQIELGFKEAYIELHNEAKKSYDPLEEYTLEKVTDTHAFLRKLQSLPAPR